jgi:hypothetical protein
MWGSIVLITVSMTVITVLHSAEVVHVPHKLWSSLLARYPLYKWAPLHTSGECARTSLQGCSIVSPSLQCTHWGFTGGVSPDHQGPPLAPCDSQESPLIYPLIPNQTDPKRAHSFHTSDWYAKLGSTTYYTRLYPYRLMVVLFSWVVTLWTGPSIWAWWLTTGFRSPPDKASIYRNWSNIVPNLSPQIPIDHTNKESK